MTQKKSEMVNNLSKFSIARKIVMFGTYMCEVPAFETHLLQSFKFLKVPQNFEFKKKMIEITIHFRDIEILQLCRDPKMPTIS